MAGAGWVGARRGGAERQVFVQEAGQYSWIGFFPSSRVNANTLEHIENTSLQLMIHLVPVRRWEGFEWLMVTATVTLMVTH